MILRVQIADKIRTPTLTEFVLPQRFLLKDRMEKPMPYLTDEILGSSLASIALLKFNRLNHIRLMKVFQRIKIPHKWGYRTNLKKVSLVDTNLDKREFYQANHFNTNIAWKTS
jgi:hypothetical protein